MCRNGIFLLGVFVVSIFFCSAVYAQETLSIVTYYPAPFGVYRELQVQGSDNANIISGLARNDYSPTGTTPEDNAAIVMIDNTATGGDGHPQIQFQNHAYSDRNTNDPDFTIGLADDNNFWIIGGQGATSSGPVGNVGPGTVTFASRDDSTPANIVPGRIRVGEIWFCSGY